MATYTLPFADCRARLVAVKDGYKPFDTIPILDDHVDKIKTCISNGDRAGLEKHLGFFVPCSDTYWTRSGYVHSRAIMGSTTYNYECRIEARPFIEWLFFKDREKFFNLIDVLLSTTKKKDTKKKEQLAKAFLAAFTLTDLSDPELVKFDEMFHLKLADGIQKLRHHGLSLKEKPKQDAKDRGVQIEQEADEMDGWLTKYWQKKTTEQKAEPDKKYESPSKAISMKAETYTRQLQNLHFKLLVARNILEIRDKFKKHRDNGLAIVLSNILSVLITGGIANIILRIATRGAHGRWLFFQPTQSQERLEGIEDDLRLNKLTPAS